MEYLDNLITRLAEKCTTISPSGGYAGSFGGTVDSTEITVDSTIVTSDETI